MRVQNSPSRRRRGELQKERRKVGVGRLVGWPLGVVKGARRQRRAEGDDAAGDGAPVREAQAHGRIAVPGLPAKLLERRNALVAARVLALAEPPKGMAEAAVAGVVDVVGR